ncbi:hypothetical protein PR048_015110 [Dryococelus australis]|uniref:ABC transporter domain-containing protein n=1 Tax=Dryococelus australis TaxID=614101 RepID=A0ABQ9HH06_9NEOP|nr:hypothetical protein PR048_015110 [Dryococelus australis]
MIVVVGSYGLLGSSGAGKTTLLTCVVGQQVLDAGEIRVAGVTPGHRSGGVPGTKIGYMPQVRKLTAAVCLGHRGVV